MSGVPINTIHLYFYTDSVGFPRLGEQRLEQTWPFLLKDRLEAEHGVRVYPCLRGLGGATISELRSIFLRDIGYFCGSGGSTLSVVIFNTGIVDAAPQPFTFRLRWLSGIPWVGPRLWSAIQPALAQNRAVLQRLWAYRQTSPARFQRVFNQMIRQVKRLNMFGISIDTPLTPESLEARSPGLRESIRRYNALKNANTDVVHVSTDWVRDEHLVDDGHHFKNVGHELLADKLAESVRGLLR